MLPKTLSNGACSLNAGEEKYTLSAMISLTDAGEIKGVKIEPSVIVSRVRGVYSEVNAIFSENADAEILKKYKEIIPTLTKMRELYLTLEKKNRERGAISFEEREAPAYDEAAVLASKAAKQPAAKLPCGCPGTNSKTIKRDECPSATTSDGAQSQLSQWPVQIKLVPVNAPYFDGANLLVAADCTAYAYGNFHNEFIRNRITLIGCPKLDDVDYTDKLTAIIANNNIKSVTVVRMEVPCCGGIENAVKRALMASGKFIPWRVVTVTTDGRVID
jgi:hypothetical protein